MQVKTWTLQESGVDSQVVAKTYAQYCPLAHALDLVGERWSLLVVKELVHGPLRYSDLQERLGCPTNILAARLKRFEADGIVARRRLPPPAASSVYELTEHGAALKPVLHELAHWGARSLGPPPEGLEGLRGWLANALELTLPDERGGCVEFRIDDERAWVTSDGVYDEPPSEPDTVVRGNARGLYHLLIDGDVKGLRIEGDRSFVDRLLERPTAAPVV
jgi:DNA-binding HxlR family transcriptional regulator